MGSTDRGRSVRFGRMDGLGIPPDGLALSSSLWVVMVGKAHGQAVISGSTMSREMNRYIHELGRIRGLDEGISRFRGLRGATYFMPACKSLSS
jgi:hypothetical protein